MVATFNKFGIQFTYPDNWKVTEEEEEQRSVTIESPASAFWSVRIYDDQNERRVLDGLIAAMEKEYDELEIHDEIETLAEQESIGAQMSFYFQNWLVSARVRCLRRGDETYCIFWQAEDREFDENELVFLAMNTTLLMDDR